MATYWIRIGDDGYSQTSDDPDGEDAEWAPLELDHAGTTGAGWVQQVEAEMAERCQSWVDGGSWGGGDQWSTRNGHAIEMSWQAHDTEHCPDHDCGGYGEACTAGSGTYTQAVDHSRMIARALDEYRGTVEDCEHDWRDTDGPWTNMETCAHCHLGRHEVEDADGLGTGDLAYHGPDVED